MIKIAGEVQHAHTRLRWYLLVASVFIVTTIAAGAILIIRIPTHSSILIGVATVFATLSSLASAWHARKAEREIKMFKNLLEDPDGSSKVISLAEQLIKTGNIN
jgi:hypothetical protein